MREPDQPCLNSCSVCCNRGEAMRQLAFIAVVLLTLAAPSRASAAAFFLFDRSTAAPNDRVTIRTGATPKHFNLGKRAKPLQRRIRLYLVREAVAAQVRSRLDPRLNFVGSLVPDKNGRGLLTFSLPPVDAGSYTLAFWCPACAAFSHGRMFFVQEPNQFTPRYRAQALLKITTTASCPVTLPNGNQPPGQPPLVSWYGNGLLWAGLPTDGVYAVAPDQAAADGSIGDKLLWVTTPPGRAPTLSGGTARRGFAAAAGTRHEQGVILGRLQSIIHESRRLSSSGLLETARARRRCQPHLRCEHHRSLEAEDAHAGVSPDPPSPTKPRVMPDQPPERASSRLSAARRSSDAVNRVRQR
jgi:hypothetical protein